MIRSIRPMVTVALLVTGVLGATLIAHPMTLKGTVAAVEPKQIQIKTGEEKKGEAPAWLIIDAKTKIMRDKTVLTFDDAKIKVGERAVVNVDHDANGVMKALEIRLAKQ